MKKTSNSKPHKTNGMRSEYRFDYRKARPNRFAARGKERVIVVLDPDVSKVFKTPKSVNAALRALISAIPRTAKRKAA